MTGSEDGALLPDLAAFFAFFAVFFGGADSSVVVDDSVVVSVVVSVVDDCSALSLARRVALPLMSVERTRSPQEHRSVL